LLCLQQMVAAPRETSESPRIDLASRVLSKLTHFARVYPVGKPEKLRCKGDFYAITGEQRKAVELWRESSRQAIKLNMVLAAYHAADRLKRTDQGAGSKASEAAFALSQSFTARSDVRDIVEHAVIDGVGKCIPLSTPPPRGREN